MIVSPGASFQTESGETVKIDWQLGEGAQGKVYMATDIAMRRRLVVKFFEDKGDRADTLARIRFLVSQRLSDTCPDIAAPLSVIDDNGAFGYCSNYVNGQTLEEYLKAPKCSFQERIIIAHDCARLVGQLHQRQIIYGDIGARNFMIEGNSPQLRVHAIDLDNFMAHGAPPCSMIGQRLYLPPELRRALLGNYPVAPTLHSDRYELGVLIHEIVLLTHPSAGHGNSEDEFDRAMLEPWLLDPISSQTTASTSCGCPVGVLSSDLCGRFREVFGKDPSKRPKADQWANLLDRESNKVYTCAVCKEQCLLDSSKRECPFCHHPLSVPTLFILSTKRQIRLVRSITYIGRIELDGRPTVSSKHAIFRRIGSELLMESYGRNGSYRKTALGWTRIPNGSPVRILKNERLKFADVEVEVRS